MPVRAPMLPSRSRIPPIAHSGQPRRRRKGRRWWTGERSGGTTELGCVFAADGVGKEQTDRRHRNDIDHQAACS